VPSGGRQRGGAPARLVALAGALLLAECLAAPAAVASPSPAAVGIQPGDVPGYSPVSPTLTSLTSTTLPAALRQCASSDPLLGQFGTGPAATISTLYGQGEGPFGVPALLVGTAVFTDGSAADAQHAYTLLASPSLQSCWLSTYETITTAIVSGLATLLTGSQTTLPDLSLGSNVQSASFGFVENVSALGETVRDSLGVTAIHVGTIVTLLFTLATNETFPETVRVGVAHDVAGRMGATPTPPPVTVTKAKACRHAGIPTPTAPLLTTAQVDGVVHARARFEGERTSGSSLCVWADRTYSRLTDGSTPAAVTTTWQVLVDGPLTSPAAARKAYRSAGAPASVAVTLPHLGDAAELVTGPTFSPSPWLLVRAGRYFLRFSSATAVDSPTESAILQGLATAVLVRLKFTPAHSTKTLGAKSWPTDWAGRTFCAAYGQPYLATFRGVASCGERFVGRTSNLQGAICYPAHAPLHTSCRRSGEVTFDTTGFQCVEYADRYFYYTTGIGTFPLDPGSDTAEALYYRFHARNPGLGLVPPGTLGATSRFKPTLVKGDIISMWRSTPGDGWAADTTGHVAVVTRVHVTHGSGRITMINQNAQGGITHITVSTGVLSYGGGEFVSFQWLTGLPT
jgi:hypothetical protein